MVLVEISEAAERVRPGSHLSGDSVSCPGTPLRRSGSHLSGDPVSCPGTPLRRSVLAGERRLAVPGPLGRFLPGGGLQRGTVVAVEGGAGSGATSVLLHLLAAATAAGEWAAAVDPEGSLGGLAAAEAGVALERLAVVRGVAPAAWPRVVSTLVEGMALVVAGVPPRLRVGDARRLAARARERAAVLVVTGPWPVEAALRLRGEGSEWAGLGWGEGLLQERVLRVEVSGRGAAGRERVAELRAAS